MTDIDSEAPHPPAGWLDTLVSAWDAHRATLIRLIRYSAVSAVATTTSLITLGVLVGGLGVAAVWSNLVATAVGTVPSFELNRRWVWKSSRRSLIGQVAPFCALSMLGLLISTVTVGLAAHLSGSWDRLDHTLAVESASIAAYGTLWVIQYQLLNRVLFRTTPDEKPARSDESTVGADTEDRPHASASVPVPGAEGRIPLPN